MAVPYLEFWLVHDFPCQDARVAAVTTEQGRQSGGQCCSLRGVGFPRRWNRRRTGEQDKVEVDVVLRRQAQGGVKIGIHGRIQASWHTRCVPRDLVRVAGKYPPTYD